MHPLPHGWIQQHDPRSGRIFYVNTVTGVSQWSHPQSLIPAQMQPNRGAMRDPPLPPGYIAQYDQQYGRYFYVNTSTGQSSWERPRVNVGVGFPHHYTLPAHSSSQNIRPVTNDPLSNQHSFQSSTFPRPQISHPVVNNAEVQSLDRQNPLPHGYINQVDPSTGRLYYINTYTGKTQWEDPRHNSSVNHPATVPNQTRPQSSQLNHSNNTENSNQYSTAASLMETPTPTPSQKPSQNSLNSFPKPLPAEFIAAQDSSGKTYFVNVTTGKKQWNDPRLEAANEKPDIQELSITNQFLDQVLIGEKAGVDECLSETLISRPNAPPKDEMQSNLNDFQPSAPIENDLESLSVNESRPSLPRRSSPKEPSFPKSSSQSPWSSLSTKVGRKISQSSSFNAIIYWQKDYTAFKEDIDWEIEESFSTVQEAVGYVVFDYMVSIFNLLPQINESCSRLNKELEEVVSELCIGNQEFAPKDQQLRRTILEEFLRQLRRLRNSFESDRRDFLANLEHRIIRYLVFKSIPLSNISKIEEFPEFLNSFIKAVSSTSLNLQEFLAQTIVASLEVYQLLLESLEAKIVTLDHRYGSLFKASLKNGISETCKKLEESYWNEKFPPCTYSLSPHRESKVYSLCGPQVFSLSQLTSAPEMLLMEHPDSILLAPLHIATMPVYYQAVEAMCSYEKENIDDDQLLSILLCHPPESAKDLLSTYHVTDKSKIEKLLRETKANRAKLISFAFVSSSPLPSADLSSANDGKWGTFPLPAKSPSLSVTSLTLPHKSPDLSASSGKSEDVSRNTRLYPIDNPNKVKNWDGSDGF